MESKFYCIYCHNEGIPIVRRNGRKRESSHLKKLYCLHCKKETNHVEIKENTHYDKNCFDLECKYGNFDVNGNRIMKFGEFKNKLRKEGVI